MVLETPETLPKAYTLQERYASLFRVFQTIGTHRTPSDLFRSLAKELRTVVEFDVLGYTHYDAETQKRLFSVIETRFERLQLTDLDSCDSPSAWVHEHQKPLVIPCIYEETRFPRVVELLKREDIRSLCAVPLRTAHRRLGGFGIGSRQPDAFSPEEVEFLSLIADQVALAIDDAFHFQALQQEKDRLKMLLEVNNAVTSNLELPELLRAVSASLRTVMQSEGAGVALLDPATNRLRMCAIDYPKNDGKIVEGEFLAEDNPAVRALLSGEQVVSEMGGDQGTRKLVCHMPLISRERVLGTLGVGRSQDFSPQDLLFLKQVSGQISIAVENALAYGEIAELKDKLARENLYLEDEIRSELNFEEIIGKSDALKKVLRQVETVAPTDSTVLIYGETGTGKELIARAIHDLSSRAKNAFVKLNCAAIPTGLLESEMFGHERGAFTGAVSQRIGRFELANRGTVFLDEIGEIPLELQPKLLRVLQEREFERLGSSRTLQTDARLIAATNRDLSEMVAGHTFRADLFYRLNVFPIQLPPLRERREDIPLLVRHFVQQFARRMNRSIDTIPSETMSVLVSYHWPGNIRELQNLVERAVILSSGPVLKVPLNDLQAQTQSSLAAAGKFETLEEVERRHILETLQSTDWVVSGPKGAAERLGLKRSTLQVRMAKLGIRRARAAAE